MVSDRIDWSKWFEYSEESPSGLIWKVDIFNTKGYATKIRAGMQAGGKKIDRGSYYKVKFCGDPYAVHSIIYVLLKGEIPEGFLVDHKDGNGLNNKISNLRIVPRAVNCRNAKRNSLNSSGVAGVSITKVSHKNYEDTVARAEWYDLEGNKKSRQFSFRKYGKDGAIQLAAAARKTAIDLLNLQGAQYSERHGTVYEQQ